MAACSFSDLSCLVKAPSKEVVLKTCQDAFLFRDRCNVPETVLKSVAMIYGISEQKVKDLLVSLGALLKSVVFQGMSDPAQVIQLFPDDFHKNLRDLLTKMIIENMAAWRAQAINNQVSLPQMIDFDWRVDIKTAGDSIARMSLPTCLLQMSVQENATRVDTVPKISSVTVELSKETLDAMLDGLSKIRDQLSSVANK